MSRRLTKYEQETIITFNLGAIASSFLTPEKRGVFDGQRTTFNEGCFE